MIFRDTGPIKCKLRSDWNFGVWLGRDSQDDMHILGTRQDIVKTRGAKRTIPSERYDHQLLLQMKGRPNDIKGDKVFEARPLAQLTPGTSSSSSSTAPMASSGLAMATTPATSTDLTGKEDTNHMDVEQQNAERRHQIEGETADEDVRVPEGRGLQVELLSLCRKELLPQGRLPEARGGDAAEEDHEVSEAG